jgi:hypothetical protein
MDRVARGNQAINLTTNVIYETLTNVSVHPEAAIYETGKLAFHDDGHDHTGGEEGALIEITTNLVSNSQFDRSISPSGYPDHWLPSGYPNAPISMYRQTDGGYFGTYCCYISGVPYHNNTTNIDEIPYMYQTIIAPSGSTWTISPSGGDFASRQVTIGAYARGYHTRGVNDNCGMLIGIYSDSIGYIWNHFTIDDDYTLYKSTINVPATVNSPLSLLIAPSGECWIDGVQASLGKRLPATIPRYNEKDVDAWNRLVGMYVDISDYSIKPRDIVVQDYNNRASVRHAGNLEWGVRAVGVSIAKSSPVSGAPIAVCVYGQAEVNVFGPVSIGDNIYSANKVGYKGYGISDTYLDTTPTTMNDIIPVAISLDYSAEQGPHYILCYITYNSGGGFSGHVIELDWSATISIVDVGCENTYELTTEGDTTINGSGGTPSSECSFVFTNNGSGDHLITMGTGFMSNGKIVCSKEEVTTVTFRYDNTVWNEVSRMYGMVRTPYPYTTISGL